MSSIREPNSLLQNSRFTTKPATEDIIDQETLLEMKMTVHRRLVEEFDREILGQANQKIMRDKIVELVTITLSQQRIPLPSRVRDKLIEEVGYEVWGYGPIQPLIDDPTITEIMVNQPRQVYIERDGKLELTNIIFKDNAHIMRVIEKIVTPLGRRIDEAMPMVDARLPDGSRVNAIIPPLSLKGPTLTIRKFSKTPYTANDLIRFGTMTHEMSGFLQACVEARLNIIISGGTGSGKTTTLNVLSAFIPDTERITTIEDAAELQLQQPHVVTLESRPPSIEGTGEITIRMLVRNSLRMRPDRIIVGEVRGGEALDMLQAMNTGHDGSLSTAHTNSPRDTMARLETMVLMAGTDLPSRAIREQIASAMNLIVHQARFRDGSRKITYITEIQGMEGDTIILQDLFKFHQKGVDSQGNVIGEHKPTGLRPLFMDRFESLGIKLPVDIFRAK